MKVEPFHVSKSIALKIKNATTTTLRYSTFLSMSKDSVQSILMLLKCCTREKDLCKGHRMHEDILKRRLLKKSIYIGTALVDLYAKCGALSKAQLVFDELPTQNVVSWTALIGGYAQYGHGEKALSCFEKMQQKGLSPDALTYVCILKACSSIKDAQKGSEIHAEIVKHGMLGNDSVLGTALVDMYVKCGAFAKAQQVFDVLPIQNIVSWNVLISGYFTFTAAFSWGNGVCFVTGIVDRILLDDVNYEIIEKDIYSLTNLN